MSTVDTRSPLDLGAGVAPSRTGLRLPDGMDYDAWVDVGRRLGRFSSASTWWLADWLFYGEWEYGSKYEDAIELTGLEEGTLRNYKSVAGRYGLSRRRDNLSFGHHAEVAALTDAEQEHWLDKATADNWSRNELREQVRMSRELPKPEPDPTAITLEQLKIVVRAERAERWKIAADSAGLSFNDWCAKTLDAAAG